AGRPLYETLGFHPEGLIERWEAEAHSLPVCQISAVDSTIRPGIAALDLVAFSADRTNVLNSMMAEPGALAVACLAQDRRLRGYAMARSGAQADYLGPIVAEDEPTALILLDGLLDRHSGKAVYLDFNTGFGSDTSRTRLMERGFVKQRDLVRMS